MKSIVRTIAIVTICAVLSVGCEATRNANNKQKGAVIGATTGAILGAVIGNNVGDGENSELGAVIGGVVGGGAGIIIGNEMDKQAQKIEEEIPGATVERIDNGIVVTFDENSGVYFDTAKYNINNESEVLLSKLANVMKEYTQTNIIVAGHTDNVGSESSNLLLSQRRANAVTGYLTSNGVSSGRLTTVWYGETAPATSNATAAGRAENRRVTLAIVPNETMKTNAMREANSK
ncbi:OmpA family protein [uncultured Dokdonia sp.]|uniref:OmpA family protein n=1 Tax=uncultured Dokdonia sp. TaxID=575653 RepID=UPI002609407F|nr:OmpA family protein [uncultured Dokdonia sp.]